MMVLGSSATYLLISKYGTGHDRVTSSCLVSCGSAVATVIKDMYIVSVWDYYRKFSVDVLVWISVRRVGPRGACPGSLAFAQGLIPQSASARGGRGSHFFGSAPGQRTRRTSNCRVLQTHMKHT